MKKYIFWFDEGAYTIYSGQTLGQAIERFVKDGCHEISQVTKIEEATADVVERVAP